VTGIVADSDVAGLILVNPLPEDLFSYDNHVWSDYWFVNYFKFIFFCCFSLHIPVVCICCILHCNSIVCSYILRR